MFISMGALIKRMAIDGISKKPLSFRIQKKGGFRGGAKDIFKPG
jgi:hypothetical protein